MSEHNNRSAYYHPTPAEKESLRRDPANMRWRDVWRVAHQAAGKPLFFDEVHNLLGIKPIDDHVKLHGRPVWGWWRIAEKWRDL